MSLRDPAGEHSPGPSISFLFLTVKTGQNSTHLFSLHHLLCGTNWSFVINKCDPLWSTAATSVFDPLPEMTVGVTIRVKVRVTIRATPSQHTEGPCQAGSHCNCLTGTTGTIFNVARNE